MLVNLIYQIYGRVYISSDIRGNWIRIYENILPVNDKNSLDKKFQ